VAGWAHVERRVYLLKGWFAEASAVLGRVMDQKTLLLNQGDYAFLFDALMVMGGGYFVCGDHPFYLGSVEEYDR
jgi:hypothetical protein